MRTLRTRTLFGKVAAISGLALIVALSACQATQGEVSEQSDVTTATLTPTPLATEQESTPTASATPTAVEEGQVEATGQPASDPLRFTLPTPGQLPRSSWRPPLYSAPWSLGPYDHFYFTRPIAADEVNWPLAHYRYGGVFFDPDVPHTGIDIDAPVGTPVLAAGDGRVVWVGYGLYGSGGDVLEDPYGLAVAIKHDFGYQNEPLYTVYAHLSEITVEDNQRVETGDVIGLSGETGFTTGPHLHFEVRLGKNDFFSSYNPELWLAPPQGWGVLVGRLTFPLEYLGNDGQVKVTSLATGQVWRVKPYSDSFLLNRDPYYQENLVLSDLPAGLYEVEVIYRYYVYRDEIEIRPGAVSYFVWSGYFGYQETLPSDPLPENLPVATPTP